MTEQINTSLHNYDATDHTQEKKGKFNKYAALLVALGIAGVAGCGGEKSPSPENPTAEAPANSGESTTGKLPEETGKTKYAREVKIVPLSKEARTLEDKTLPDKLAAATDEEVEEIFTISAEELGEYTSLEEYATKWAEQETILSAAIGNLGYAPNFFQTNSPSEEVDSLTQRYIDAAKLGIQPGLDTQTSSYYQSVIMHNLDSLNNFNNERGQRVTDRLQKDLLQVQPDTLKVEDNGNGTITAEYEVTTESQYDFTEQYKAKGYEPRQVFDQTSVHRVVLPEKPVNGVVIPLENKIIKCTDNRTGEDCL